MGKLTYDHCAVVRNQSAWSLTAEGNAQFTPGEFLPVSSYIYVKLEGGVSGFLVADLSEHSGDDEDVFTVGNFSSPNLRELSENNTEFQNVYPAMYFCKLFVLLL